MIGWYCRLSGHEFQQTSGGDSEGQGGLSFSCAVVRGVAKSQVPLRNRIRNFKAQTKQF